MESYGPKAQAFFAAHPEWQPSIDSCCSAGWDDILAQALEDLHDLAQRRRVVITIAQFKEKFAQLRIYIRVKGEPEQVHFDVFAAGALKSGRSPKVSRDSVTAEAVAIVNRASDQSQLVCERCGQPGVVRHFGWMRVLCDRHAAELE